MKIQNFILLSLFVAGSVFAQEGFYSDSLYQIITNDGLESGISWYNALSEEKRPTEAELNALGYRFMSEEKFQSAIGLFKLNVETHQQSPNAYDSFGEAYMQIGDFDQAIVQYEQALKVLAKSNLPKQTKDFLKTNAEGKLKYLKNPEYRKKSQLLKQFLPENGDSRFGKLHPDAPKETALWGRLVGNWNCKQFILLPNGQWVFAGKATWAWKYILDGFAIQDLWYQQFVDLPATLVSLGRDIAGTNIRVFDPAENKWNVVWFSNNNNAMTQFDAFNEGEDIVMKSTVSTQLRRITFHAITDSTFKWKREISDDNGGTWKETFRIAGQRIE